MGCRQDFNAQMNEIKTVSSWILNASYTIIIDNTEVLSPKTHNHNLEFLFTYSISLSLEGSYEQTLLYILYGVVSTLIALSLLIVAFTVPKMRKMKANIESLESENKRVLNEKKFKEE
jgi:hypothetical protein